MKKGVAPDTGDIKLFSVRKEVVLVSYGLTKPILYEVFGVSKASVSGRIYAGEMVHYGATKAELLELSRGLAENVAGSGVSVDMLIPGPTHTEESFMVRAHQTSWKTFKQIE